MSGLETYTGDLCLHATERLVKMIKTKSQDISQPVSPILKSLILIERRVVWESERTQEKFQKLVDSVGKLLSTDDISPTELLEISKQVGQFTTRILQKYSKESVASPDDILQFQAQLRTMDGRIAAIYQRLLNSTLDADMTTTMAEEYNRLNNLSCNAKSWVNDQKGNKEVIVRILGILNKHITRLEHDCSLWDRIVDTVSSFLEESHVRQCVRRSSRTA